MNLLKNTTTKIISSIIYKYTSFVYKTSSITKIGYEKLSIKDRENIVFLFWHSDSFCLYPVFREHLLYIITTKDRRGDFITEACHKFGYKTFRLPDNSDGGSYISNIVKTMGTNNADLAVSLDGPLGPLHEPKYFPIALSYLLKRNMVPISINIKKKIEVTKRWDNFKIPLPFNNIEITFHPQINANRSDKKEKFDTIIQNIKDFK